MGLKKFSKNWDEMADPIAEARQAGFILRRFEEIKIAQRHCDSTYLAIRMVRQLEEAGFLVESVMPG